MRTRLRSALFLAAAGWEIGVPLIALRSPPPARFSWQMFSAVAPRPSFRRRGRDGALRGVDLESLLGNARGDLQVPSDVWRQLCGLLPETTAIEVTPPGGAPQTWPCP